MHGDLTYCQRRAAAWRSGPARCLSFWRRAPWPPLVPRPPRRPTPSARPPSSNEEPSHHGDFTFEKRLSENQLRGWRAVSAAGMEGEGLRKKMFFSQTPV